MEVHFLTFPWITNLSLREGIEYSVVVYCFQT